MEKPTEIETGFRIIRLTYNNQKEKLSDFEHKLLNNYQHLHKKVLNFTDQIELMDSIYAEIISMFDEVKKRFDALVILQKEVMSFHQMKIAEKDIVQLQRVENRVKTYNHDNTELVNIIIPLKDKFDTAWQLRNDIIEVEINMDTDFESFGDLTHELYQNYEKYEIDIVQFDHDEQDFLTMLGFVTKRWNKLYTDFTNFTDCYCDLVKKYNEFIDYTEKNKIIQPITVQLPETPDTDPKQRNQKHFYIKPNDPKIPRYSEILNKAAALGKGITINIDLDQPEEENLNHITDIIKVSQHNIKWIENIIFKINLNFTDLWSQENKFQNPLRDTKMMMLFYKLVRNPGIYFFLNNLDYRVFCLSADLILDNKLEMRDCCTPDDDPYTEIGFRAEDINTIFNRFFDACAFFYMYCENTSIDTRLYIESAIATMLQSFNLEKDQLDISYDDVVEHCKALKSLPYPLTNSLN